MMLKSRWIRIALVAFPGMTASCAVSLPPSVEPPRLTLPRMATTPCVLERLPDSPTEADLEVAYIERGARLVACEQARGLAVETLLAERTLQDGWRRETEARRRPRAWFW
jgi:hypothetical protein